MDIQQMSLLAILQVLKILTMERSVSWDIHNLKYHSKTIIKQLMQVLYKNAKVGTCFLLYGSITVLLVMNRQIYKYLDINKVIILAVYNSLLEVKLKTLDFLTQFELKVQIYSCNSWK